MAKTSVNTLISSLKRRFDYNITDTSLDALMLDLINDAIKTVKQALFNAGLNRDITGSASFQTIPGREYKDLQKACIIGDKTTFTGIAGDKLCVTIDGTPEDDIDISACTDIDDVVTAINAAVGSTVASNNATSGTLQIESTTSGATSSVTIADGGTTAQTVVGDLFSVSADRTASAITDVDDILIFTDRYNDNISDILPYYRFKELYPDPTEDSSVSPDNISVHNGYIYMGPTPSSYRRQYIDYVKYISDVAAGGTMPFEDKYDQVIMAICRLEFLLWQDPSNGVAIQAARVMRETAMSELIILAARNTGVNLQSESRNGGGFTGPRVPTSMDTSAG